MKGIKGVWAARVFLESKGFIVSEPQSETSNGHDLVALKNGRGYTFEVKPATFTARCYRVKKVSKITSDGIIIIFPSGHCQIESMKNHLKMCSKSGHRCLTFIGNVVCD